MTRRAAIGKLLAAPRDHADMGRIGLKPRRPGYDKPDGRERLNYTVRVLRTVLRKTA